MNPISSINFAVVMDDSAWAFIAAFMTDDANCSSGNSLSRVMSSCMRVLLFWPGLELVSLGLARTWKSFLPNAATGCHQSTIMSSKTFAKNGKFTNDINRILAAAVALAFEKATQWHTMHPKVD